MRVVFRVDSSLVVGTGHVKSIRPVYGLKPKYYDSILGKKKIIKNVSAGTPVASDLFQIQDEVP